MTDEQEDDYEDEDDIPLSLLAQQLRVDQSFLQNVDIEPPTEENAGNWERDLMSSFVEPIAEESNKQFVHDDEEKHVDVPGSNLSHREVLDMVIKLKHSSKDENYLQLVLELENLTKRKKLNNVVVRCN